MFASMAAFGQTQINTNQIKNGAVTGVKLGTTSSSQLATALSDEVGSSGGFMMSVTSATAITDASTMDIASKKNTLSTSSATRTFTISYTGDDITLEVTLGTTATTFTFPATTLCVSEGVPTGDNNMSLSGDSGDKYIIAVKKIGSNYYAVSKNFKQ